jgi:hypothetical protein
MGCEDAGNRVKKVSTSRIVRTETPCTTSAVRVTTLRVRMSNRHRMVNKPKHAALYEDADNSPRPTPTISRINDREEPAQAAIVSRETMPERERVAST